MKKSLLVLAITAVGCAHQPDSPSVVNFPYAPELLKSIQGEAPKGRAPASAPVLEAKEEKSPRRVYFSTLYHQHLVLGAHLREENAVASCPAFHHDKVEADSYGVPKISPYGAKQVAEDGKEYFPELVFEEKFSLSEYYATLKEELQTLCEEGVSDNSFKFDNLITHYAKKPSFHLRPSAMESVLKIPIFANFYLIRMLDTRKDLAVVYPEEKLFIQMSETHWFDRYVVAASRLRDNYLRNKMVKR